MSIFHAMKQMNIENFNCLFCYCPLYMLGENCGGSFNLKNGVKDCSQCMIPHKRENYGYITGKFSEIAAAMNFSKDQQQE